MATASRLLADFPFSWFVCWLLLPNLLVILMWPFVGVPMQAGMVISGGLALVMPQMPWRAARAVGVIVITMLVVTLYVCQLFAIPPLNLQLIQQFLTDVRPLQSVEYIAGICLVLAILAATAYLAPQVRPFSSHSQFLLAALAVGVLVSLDGAFAADARRFHTSLPSAETPVDSAVRQVSLGPADVKRRHVLLIVVESLGMPAAPEEKVLLAADWNRPEWRERYDVRIGSTQYFGSTTNGELRELCDRWTHYQTVDWTQADCLPRKFRDAGYDTTAVHSFSGDLFGRQGWYPKIGFRHTVFGPDLLRAGARECPGVFSGACDVDVPAIITRRLAEADRPQFLYWLTLNSHLPVVADKVLGTDRCTLGTPQWREDFPALCRLFQAHHHLANRISGMLMAPDFPATDILIVGDHKPPIFDRVSNARFDPGRVAWIYLRSKRVGGGLSDVTSPRIAASE